MPDDHTFSYRKALLIPLNSKQEILIQDRRGYKKPDWSFFGGEIEVGESALDAVIRETKEELQIDVEPEELIYLGTSIVRWNSEGRELSALRYLYVYRTDQAKFNVTEGRGGHWLGWEETKRRMDCSEQLDDIIERINKALSSAKM